MSSLPKSLNCRLGEGDLDIQEDLSKFTDSKTERIKAIYRLGLQAEATKDKVPTTPKPVRIFKLVTPSKPKPVEHTTLRPADPGTVAFYEDRIKLLEAQLRNAPKAYEYEKRIKELEDRLESSRRSTYRASVRHIKEPSPILYTR